MMKTLQIKPVPVPPGCDHPKSPHMCLPKHEFSMGLIAPKGSGKTTLIINLLQFYKGYFHTIVVFSPTIRNDEKWKYVKELPLLVENKPLKKFFKKQEEKRKKAEYQVVEPAPKNLYTGDVVQKLPKRNERDKFDPRIPDECFIVDYNHDTLAEILADQQKMIDYLEELDEPKYLANRMLFILDDLVGSSLYSSSRSNPFKMLNTNHRHFSCSLIEVSQAYREIQKTVRTNWSCLILFNIFNEKELEAIYEEFPMHLKRPQWDEVFQYCTGTDHDFLFYNMKQKDKRMRIMKNFQEFVFTGDSKKRKSEFTEQ